MGNRSGHIPGHIPGAIHLSHPEKAGTGGNLLIYQTLQRQILSELGIGTDIQVIAYYRSTVLAYLTMEQASYNVRQRRFLHRTDVKLWIIVREGLDWANAYEVLRRTRTLDVRRQGPLS